jgi:hypothetical protein
MTDDGRHKRGIEVGFDLKFLRANFKTPNLISPRCRGSRPPLRGGFKSRLSLHIGKLAITKTILHKFRQLAKLTLMQEGF